MQRFTAIVLFIVGLLLFLVVLSAPQASGRSELLETARYLDGHADALNYEARILQLQYQRAEEQARERHMTLRIGLGLGALVGVTWAGAWAATRHRRPPYQPPPPHVLDLHQMRRLEAAEWDRQWER